MTVGGDMRRGHGVNEPKDRWTTKIRLSNAGVLSRCGLRYGPSTFENGRRLTFLVSDEAECYRKVLDRH